MTSFFHSPNRLELCLCAVLTVSGLILLSLYNHFWSPPDEGIFAHLADRVNAGELYGVDFQEAHPGYHTLWNALMFKVFGRDLLSLRYPMVVLELLKVFMAFCLLRSRGAMIATLGALAVFAIGFIQFINPSPNWYALFFAFLCVFLLREEKRKTGALFAAGLVIGLCLMFRHPSGIFLGGGVLAFLLFQAEPEAGRKGGVLQYILLAVLLAGLVTYNALLWVPNLFVMIGIWPILMTLLLFRLPPLPDRDLVRLLMPAATGFAAAVLPMPLYQLFFGDIALWFESSFLHSSRILEADFFATQSYLNFWRQGVDYFRGEPGIATFANIIYWTLLCALPVAAGVAALRALLRREKSVPAAAIVAPYFAYVSIYYQTPFYFYCSLGLLLLGLLAQPGLVRKSVENYAYPICLAVLTLTGICMYAGKTPYMFGKPDEVEAQYPGTSIHIKRGYKTIYDNILAEIDRHAGPDDPIFAFPSSAEIYYLSRRPNALTYASSFYALASEEDYQRTVEVLKEKKPKIIFYRAPDKYAGEYERRLAEWLVREGGYRVKEEVAETYTAFILSD